MSIPAELSLVSKDGQYHLKFQPVRELQAVLSPIHQLEKGKTTPGFPLTEHHWTFIFPGRHRKKE